MKNDINIHYIKNILEQHNIKPSIQRLKIYKFIYGNTSHPTVDDIYKHLHEEIPSLSKTTIYNTLKLFHKNKLVSAITIEENEVRYDYNTTPHAHFKCIKCGKILDLEINLENLNIDNIDGNKILEKQLYFTGICKECLSKK